MSIQDYTIYCTKEQTRRALKLGAPITIVKSKRTKETILADDVIEFDDDTFTYVVPPTTQQMIGWLREEKGIVIVVSHFYYTYSYSVSICINKFDKSIAFCKEYMPYKQAELAAIDAALDYLEKGE